MYHYISLVYFIGLTVIYSFCSSLLFLQFLIPNRPPRVPQAPPEGARFNNASSASDPILNADQDIIEHVGGGDVQRPKKKAKVRNDTRPPAWKPEHWQLFLWTGPWAAKESDNSLTHLNAIFDCIHYINNIL